MKVIEAHRNAEINWLKERNKSIYKSKGIYNKKNNTQILKHWVEEISVSNEMRNKYSNSDDDTK